MTIVEDENKGWQMFEEEKKETKAGEYKAGHMFESDRASHKMTTKKQKIIAITVAVVAVIVIIVMLILSIKWRREYMARLISGY